MTRIRRPIGPLGLAMMLSLSASTLSGCGDPPPPTVTPESFEAGKKEAEKIIQKEYGAKAFKKGEALEKSRTKK